MANKNVQTAVEFSYKYKTSNAIACTVFAMIVAKTSNEGLAEEIAVKFLANMSNAQYLALYGKALGAAKVSQSSFEKINQAVSAAIAKRANLGNDDYSFFDK